MIHVKSFDDMVSEPAAQHGIECNRDPRYQESEGVSPIVETERLFHPFSSNPVGLFRNQQSSPLTLRFPCLGGIELYAIDN